MSYLGVFERFWFWTYEYALAYGIPLEGAWVNLKDGMLGVTRNFISFWLSALVGAGLLYNVKVNQSNKMFIAGIFLFGFLAICPGLIFRDHYFILWLPGVGIMAAVAFYYLGQVLGRINKYGTIAPAMLFSIFMVIGIHKDRNFFFYDAPEKISRDVFGLNPFPETIKIGEYIKNKTSPKDKIMVIGSEPQIYLYANRRAASGYIYTYGLVDGNRYNQQMLEEMFQQIEANKPKVIVYCNIPTSWGIQEPAMKGFLMEKLIKYVNANGFQLTGVVDMQEDGSAIYKWGPEAQHHDSKLKAFLHILERK